MASKIVVNLDTSKEIYESYKCKQNDDLTLIANIYENGEAKDLSNCSIVIQALKADNTYIIQNTDITKSNNTFTAELVRDFTRVPGTTKIEVVLVESGKQNTTFSFYLEVVGSVIRGAVESKDGITALENVQAAVTEIDRINKETQTLLNNAGAASKEEVNILNAHLADKAEKTYVDTRIGNMGNTKTFKGSCLYSALPTSGAKLDDYWYVTDKSTNYCWNGTSWIDIGNNLKLGDKTITPIKTSFMKDNNLLNTENCLVDKAPKWVGYNNDLTSDTNVSDSPNYITSHIFECNEGETWIYEGGHLGSNIYYADSTKVLKQAIEVNNKTAFVIPIGMKYFRAVFTYNSSDYNNNQWKTKFKVVKGNSVENIAPYGKNMMKDLVLDEGIVKEKHLSQELKDKINAINTENDTLIIPKGTSYSDGEAIVLLNFDGWNQNTFNVIAPYIQEKGLSYTLFFTGYDKSTGINPNDLRKHMKQMGNKFEFGMYTGQPSSTMESSDNFKEQMAQIKASYDGIVNYGLPRPSMCAYAGGVKTELTEYLCQNCFGQKIGRTTENSAIVNPVTTTFSIPCSGYGDDGVYTISVIDSIVANKQHRAVMTHNILNGSDVTDTSYNMRESYLKAWIDKIALEVSKGTLKCMTFYEYYLYTILPHTSSVGQHALVWENDGRQHEYVYTEKGWIELTDFQSYR